MFGRSKSATAAEFRALFQQYAPFVWRALRRYGVRDADLEDVCQEVFMVVHRRLGEFEGRSSVRTWIYEIARRSALAQRRALLRRREQTAPDTHEIRDTQRLQDGRLEDARALQWLEHALAALPEEKREAFALYELEEMTLAEVAEAMGCALNTVHYRVTTARSELQALAKRPVTRHSAATAPIRTSNEEAP